MGKTRCFFHHDRQLSDLRRRLPALRYGQQHFRSVGGNGTDFGLSTDVDGIVAFSRILAGTEVLVVANTSAFGRFDDHMLVDTVINGGKNASMKMEISHPGTPSHRCALTSSNVVSWENGVRGDSFHATHMRVNLAPMELQIFTQVG